jgi:HK97 gp10 family phage protein
MSKLFSIVEFVAHLEGVRRDLDRLGPKIVLRAAQAVCARAKEVIGTYDYDWPQLAPSTIAQRVRDGFALNEPLLRTGELRDSIEYTISHDGLEAYVGSDKDKAVWHELGTSKAPPHPFLVPSAQELEPKIHKAAARATVAVLMGKGLLSAEMNELLELLRLVKETAHHAAENLKPLVIGEEQESREQRR